MTWGLITGEYPPQPGGVSDYTRLVARSLSECGDEVHVWAPECQGPDGETKPIHVHRLPGHFGPKALAMLDRQLSLLPNCRILVQYVPHAFGWKAMNVPFCLWLARRRPYWVMYHEVSAPFGWSYPIKQNVVGWVTRGMAWIVAAGAERIYISVPTWETLLPKRRPVTWLPVPSNVTTTVDPQVVAQVRSRLISQSGHVLIGHFGTYGPQVASSLVQLLPELLAAGAHRQVLLLGGGGDRFARDLLQRRPELQTRVIATGALPAPELAAHLAACDLLIQPYVDGVSSRRGSVMAGLALGLPIVTTEGFLTEPLWKESGAVALALGPSVPAFLAETEALLADPGRQTRLRHSAAALYQDRFALSNTIRALRS